MRSDYMRNSQASTRNYHLDVLRERSSMLRIFRRQRASTSSWASQTLPQGIRAQQIDGRRHLTEQPYALPKDLTEQDRLKFQHYALRATLKANYVVPLPDNIKFILDVG